MIILMIHFSQRKPHLKKKKEGLKVFKEKTIKTIKRTINKPDISKALIK